MEAPKQWRLARLQRAFAWIRRTARRITSKRREEQFTREEQLWMVVIAHALILAGVFAIMGLAFGSARSLPPRGFWILELAIIVCSYIALSARSEHLISAIEKSIVSLNWLKVFIQEHRSWKDKAQSIVLLAVYALQIAALVPLLTATGGPIDSPFAPMALAIAVFTPFIVNKWWTIGFIVISTMVFYAVFVFSFGFDAEEAQAKSKHPRQAVVKAAEERPDPTSFIAVNLFILFLATVMTLKRRDSRSFTMTRMIGAPRKEVWRSWTDPTCVASWFGVENKVDAMIEMDVREGGKWSAAIRRSDGTMGVPWTGTYEEVKEPEQLIFTLAGRPDLGHDLVSVTLKEIDGKTEMIVRQSDDGRFSELKEGWLTFFDRMESHLLTEKTVPETSNRSKGLRPADDE